MQKGLGLVGAIIGAAATLSGDSTLGWISRAFSLFVAVKGHIAIKKAEQAAKDAENNKPAEDPVEQAQTETASSGENSTTNTESPEATQPPPAEEPPKTIEDTVKEIEPAPPVETPPPAPASETAQEPTVVVETKPVPKSSKEKIVAAYDDAKKLANATHEQMEVIAKNHQLTDAEFLYLCARYAYDIKKFDKKLLKTKTGKKYWETYCNQYAGYVYYLYTGSTQLINNGGKSLIQTLNVAGQIGVVKASDSGWSKVNSGETAQNLANQGKFIIAVTPDHIAVIMPGEGVMGYGKYYSPAIAQQGASKLLYGVTFKNGINSGTLNYAWGPDAIGKVEYYGFNISD